MRWARAWASSSLCEDQARAGCGTMLSLIVAGLLTGAGFLGMAFLRDLRAQIVPFLSLNGLAFVGYGIAVRQVLRGADRRRALPLILGFAVLFRVTLLFATPPTLSDDVYRYIWDGRLMNAGVSPYAHAVESPLLDRFESQQRQLVNHRWMASPYLPAAQALFASVYRISPDSPLAFQIVALLFDLLTGCLIIDLLRRLGLPRERVLISLWNPLLVVEFAHGAHVDSFMIFLIVLAPWALVALRSPYLSAIALAGATLTKGLPVLVLPVVVRRWGWRGAIVYLGLIAAVCIPFALGAGWGLTGPLTGEGLFGALRIYAADWNYNSSLYHWLEVGLSGYQTAGAVPQEVVGWQPLLAAKLIVSAVLGMVGVAVWRASRKHESDLALLRLSVVVLGAYLLLTTTVHPWYVTLIVPLSPFLPSRLPEKTGRLLLPLLFFSAAVSLSYLTYLDPPEFREYALVRFVEYVPLYALLIWAARPAIGVVRDSAPG